MSTSIFCKELTRGTHNFYITVNGEPYYLFTQKYKQSVDVYFQSPSSIEDAIDFSKSRRDFAIINTMEKIPKYIRYFEQCSGMSIMKKTIKSNQYRMLHAGA